MIHTGLFLDGLVNDTVDVGVALVGDDALRIIVHLLLTVFDVLINVVSQSLVELQLFHDLLIPLEQLDRIPAQEAVIDFALDGLLDVCDGMLHTAGKDVGQLTGLLLLGSGNRSLGSSLGAPRPSVR